MTHRTHTHTTQRHGYHAPIHRPHSQSATRNPRSILRTRAVSRHRSADQARHQVQRVVLLYVVVVDGTGVAEILAIPNEPLVVYGNACISHRLLLGNLDGAKRVSVQRDGIAIAGIGEYLCTTVEPKPWWRLLHDETSGFQYVQILHIVL